MSATMPDVGWYEGCADVATWGRVGREASLAAVQDGSASAHRSAHKAHVLAARNALVLMVHSDSPMLAALAHAHGAAGTAHAAAALQAERCATLPLCGPQGHAEPEEQS